MADKQYEVYRERFRVTEWRDGCVYHTQSEGCGWFDADVVTANRPGATNILYVAASDDYAQTHSTIRIKRGGDSK